MSVDPVSVSHSFYVVGGTMRPDAKSYVRRNADEELYNGLIENEFCHVLTARQMGKSSLMLRVAARLRDSGICVAVLDLTGIGTNLSAEQWYSGLLVQMGDRLNLEDEVLEFWKANLSIGPMQRWISAIQKVVLPSRLGRLVIFIDEIDAVASLNFSTDEFFSGIRQCYNLRNEDPEMIRLTFCLLGVVNPAELIRDTHTTPFNIGRRIELNDFTEQEALPLAMGLGRSETENCALLKRIFYWTNGHPYLTQRLCKAVFENGTDHTTRDIDVSIELMFFSKRAREYDDNLIFVRERLLRSGEDIASLLNLYSRVRKRKAVADDDSHPLVGTLRLSGIAHAENGSLRVRNRIYERVFNKEWVTANLPGAEIRRQRAAFWRGVIRTTAVAGIILTVVVALAILAFRQRNRAVEQTAVNSRLLYLARIKLAQQEYENANIARVEDLVQKTTPQGGEDLRGFEWFLFWRYAHSESLRLNKLGHIARVKFYQDGSSISIARVIHTMVQQQRQYLIELYDRASGKETVSFNVPAGTNFDIAVFSDDDKLVATDSPDNSVTLWDITSKSQIQTLPGPGKPVVALTFSSDQKLLAGTFVDGDFRVWDLKDGQMKLEGHSQLEKPGIALSPEGRHLAIGSGDNVVQIIDVESERTLYSITFPKGPLGLLFFSPDGKTLFASNADGYIYTWSFSGNRLASLDENHSNEVTSFSFSPDGRTLVTGSVDRTVKIWDAVSGKRQRTILGHGGWVTSVHLSSDGRYLLSGDAEGQISMWDIAQPELPVWPEQKPNFIVATGFTPQKTLVAIGFDGDLKLLNLSNGQTLAILGKADAVSSGVFSKGAALVAVAQGSQIRIYSVSNGKLISTLAASGVHVYSLDFSPDTTKLLSGDREGNILISEVSSGRTLARLDSQNTYYRAVFSPDGKYVASADQDGKIRIWDVASSTIIKTLSGHPQAAKLISFSPNGQLLATSGDDNALRLWDLNSGTELRAISSTAVQRLDFSPDGKRLATVSYDRAVVLWDVTDLQEVVTLQRSGRGGPPTCLKFSDDGLSLVVGDESGDVKVWQAARPNL